MSPGLSYPKHPYLLAPEYVRALPPDEWCVAEWDSSQNGLVVYGERAGIDHPDYPLVAREGGSCILVSHVAAPLLVLADIALRGSPMVILSPRRTRLSTVAATLVRLCWMSSKRLRTVQVKCTH